METRTIIEVKVYGLHLNKMTANIEHRELIAFSDDKQKLIDWYYSEKANEPYYDIGVNQFPAKGDFPSTYKGEHKYHKVFRKGSILEWYNPFGDINQISNHGHGIHEEWVKEEDLRGTPIFRVH